MNAPFNQLNLVQRLEREGIARGAAEAIAGGIEDSRSDLVTTATLRSELEVLRAELRADFAILRSEFEVLRSEFTGVKGEFAGLRTEFGGLRTEFAGLRTEFAGLREEMRLNIELLQNRLVIRLGAISLALMSLLTAVLGTSIALK